MSESETFFRRVGPDMLERRGGGGCLSIFGLPFLFAGLLIMQIPVGIIPFNMEGSSPPYIIIFVFGAVFTAVGATLVFGRNGLTVDLGSRRIHRWWGLLVPMRRKSDPLDLFNKVIFDRHEGDSDSPTTWPVSLAGDNYAARINIHAPTDYTEARRSAEELARFLNVPVEDTTAGKKVVREPGKLDEPLRDKIRRTGEDVRSLPPEPPGMKTKVSQTAEGMIAQIPAIYEGKINAAYIVFAVAWSGAIWWFVLRHLMELPAPDFVRFLLNGMFALIMIGPLWGALVHIAKRNSRSTIVIISPAFLVVEERYGRRSTKVEIPVNELEDLVLPTRKSMLEDIDFPGRGKAQPLGDTGTPRMPDGRPVPKILLSIMRHVPTPGITAVSDRQLVNIGKGLPEPELAYIHGLMRKAIAGQ